MIQNATYRFVRATEILMLNLSAENSPLTEQVNQMRQQVLSTSRLVNNY